MTLLDDELCAAGLPAALRALLHESSALLSPAAEDMEALPPVIDLVRRLVERCPRARRALLTDTPDGGGGLLLVLLAVAEYHPHARTDGTAPSAHQNAATRARQVYALLMSQVENDGVAAHATVAHLTLVGITEINDAADWRGPLVVAEQRLAMQLGLERDGSGAGASGAAAPLPPDMAAAPRVHITTSCNVNAVGGACAGCGRLRRAGEAAFQKCCRCRATPYCSRACQVADWKKHKRSCTAAPGAA
jgi:hypothetical protein